MARSEAPQTPVGSANYPSIRYAAGLRCVRREVYGAQPVSSSNSPKTSAAEIPPMEHPPELGDLPCSLPTLDVNGSVNDYVYIYVN